MKAGVLSRVLPLYLVVFIGFIGYSLMITVFTPPLLDDQGGLLPKTSSTSTRTFLGALSDRFGRRPVLLCSLVASVCLYGLIALALHLQVGAEGVSGLAGGALATISTSLPLPAMGALALLGAGLLSRPSARDAAAG